MCQYIGARTMLSLPSFYVMYLKVNLENLGEMIPLH